MGGSSPTDNGGGGNCTQNGSQCSGSCQKWVWDPKTLSGRWVTNNCFYILGIPGLGISGYCDC